MGTGIWEYDVTEIHNTLKKAAEEQLEGHPAEFTELVVFGSYGRGQASKDSDLDLLLVVSLTEELTDASRRDLFTGISTSLDQQTFDLPAPISEIDVLVCRMFHRDGVLVDCLEEVSQTELENSPCLVYSLTDQEKRSVLHP